MEIFGFPDWKKVGRRIGKGLRDTLNPPKDDGPSKEDRQAQRLRDIRKGFAYFDTFDEVAEWSPRYAPSIQMACWPLLIRSAPAVHDQTSPSTKLMLCHDYQGGYHDYEGVRPDPPPDELYICEYLQYVETFIYFSHKLVNCPPPTWTNLLHRNGVKALGTFMMEPQTPDMERMLESADGEYVIAKQLASMANTFGFDGWLLNIEKEFPENVKNLTVELTSFIVSLKRCLGPEKLVVWYDSLTTENDVDYQNGLSSKNVNFAKAADALFTNYRWDLDLLHASKAVALRHGVKTSNVYFGIDVWAQNTNMPGPRRITYPPKGGGGTNTGLAMEVLAQEGFSTAMFAPAWTYEHFSPSPSKTVQSTRTTSMARSVDRSMWKGSPLPTEIGCDCRKGKPHHTRDYQKHPILRYAREYPTGSSSYLETSFNRAFESEPAAMCPCLGFQPVLPHVSISTEESSAQALYGSLEEGSLCIWATMEDRSSREPENFEVDTCTDAALLEPKPQRLCLFKVGMPGDGSLCAIIRYTVSNITGAMGFYTAYQMPDFDELEYQYYNTQESNKITFTHYSTIQLKAQVSGGDLVELGVFSQGCHIKQPSQVIMKVTSIDIGPPAKAKRDFDIVNILVTWHEKGTDAEPCLAWQWEGSKDGWSDQLPWSQTTGPFSQFVVLIDGEPVVTTQSLEFPLRKKDYEGSSGDDVAVSIGGLLFDDGPTIWSAEKRFRRDKLSPEVFEETWCLVEKQKAN